MSTPVQNTAYGVRIPCPDCGGALVYDIGAKAMRCLNCGNRKNVTDLPDPTGDADEMDVAEFRCASCGAELQTRENMTTARCVFCGSDVLLPARMARTKRPEWIVPFKVTREECEKQFQRHLQGAKYAPSDLTGKESVGSFLPVYIPYWDYDIDGEGEKTLTAVYTRRDSAFFYRDTVEYRVMSKIHAGGHLYDASSAFDDETAERLAMTDIGRVPFHAGYLSAFFAEAPDAPADKLPRQNLRSKASEALNAAFSKQTNASASSQDPLPPVKETASLGLLPVWLMASRYGRRVLYTAVDGVNGRVICDAPPGRKKYLLLSAALSAVFFLLLYFIFLPMVVWQPQLTGALSAAMAALGFSFIYPEVYEVLRKRLTDTDYTRHRLSIAKNPSPGAGYIPGIPKEPRLYAVCLVSLSAAFLGACLYGLTQSRANMSILFYTWLSLGVASMSVLFAWAKDSKHRKLLAVSILFMILGLLCFLAALTGYFNGFVNAVFNDKGALDLLMILFSAVPVLNVLALFQRARLLLKIEIIPVLLFLPVIAVLFFARLFHSPDAVFYTCSGLLLLLLAAGALILFRCQREYATRPVPFFGKEGERK